VNRLEIRPFADEHLDDAARLLAARHARHRAAEPLLSPRYEEHEEALAEVQLAWAGDAASGAAAFREHAMVGYLIGAKRPNPVWGANTWIEAAGHAVTDAEDVRDLYGLAAARWVEEGRPRHSVLVPAHDSELLDAWARLCFGRQHAHGIRQPSTGDDTSVPDGFEIRAPREADVEQLIDVDLVLPAHQQRSPVFSGAPMWTREESREEWVKTLAASEEKIFIAVLEGSPVACWAFVPIGVSSENRGLIAPDEGTFLGFAATLPEFQGTGIGVALTNTGFAWAAGEGHPAVITDWRITNLLSSRFWPSRGFRLSFVRLYRSIP
jgi:GNAT superfamily N-acetyltransferase